MVRGVSAKDCLTVWDICAHYDANAERENFYNYKDHYNFILIQVCTEIH